MKLFEKKKKTEEEIRQETLRRVLSVLTNEAVYCRQLEEIDGTKQETLAGLTAAIFRVEKMLYDHNHN